MVTQLKEINSAVLQDSILGSVLYLLYTADLPIALGSTTVIYADNTTILAAYNNHIEASLRLQESLYNIQRWFKKCRIKANRTISTDDIHRKTCLLVTLNGQRIPQAEDAKYLGVYLDHRLNWKKKKNIYIYIYQT